METNREEIISHLEMIQDIVTRLAGNSFTLKGWSIVIVSALLGLSVNSVKTEFIYIALLPALVFWALDAYFLSTERSFRGLYNAVRKQLSDPENAESIEIFSMNFTKFEKPGDKWLPVMFSKTIFIFHGMVTFFIVAFLVALKLTAG